MARLKLCPVMSRTTIVKIIHLYILINQCEIYQLETLNWAPQTHSHKSLMNKSEKNKPIESKVDNFAKLKKINVIYVFFLGDDDTTDDWFIAGEQIRIWQWV